MKFKQIDEGHIDIFDENGQKVGHIFSPSGNSHNNINAIQVCGFSEAFDLWSCAYYNGKKDIQLLFDEHTVGGECDISMQGCQKCFRKPCQCETIEGSRFPFLMKREQDLIDRIDHKDGKVPIFGFGGEKELDDEPRLKGLGTLF